MKEELFVVENKYAFLEPEYSDWECHLFGSDGTGITWKPVVGHVPCRFWRVMQYLILGNKWRKK